MKGNFQGLKFLILLLSSSISFSHPLSLRTFHFCYFICSLAKMPTIGYWYPIPHLSIKTSCSKVGFSKLCLGQVYIIFRANHPNLCFSGSVDHKCTSTTSVSQLGAQWPFQNWAQLVVTFSLQRLPFSPPCPNVSIGSCLCKSVSRLPPLPLSSFTLLLRITSHSKSQTSGG